jgi:hypothetical protein
MCKRFRSFFAALCAVAMLASSAQPALASPSEMAVQNGPLLLDVFIMRPAGFVMFATGVGLFIASAPLVLLTRPTDIADPFNALVVKPAKYVWMDPLGGH